MCLRSQQRRTDDDCGRADGIARSQVMDGIFPLTTNTKEKPVDVYKIYKYQPKIEKRHALT